MPRHTHLYIRAGWGGTLQAPAPREVGRAGMGPGGFGRLCCGRDDNNNNDNSYNNDNNTNNNDNENT